MSMRLGGYLTWSEGLGGLSDMEFANSLILNKTFVPSHYDIELRVILEDGEPAGEIYTAPGATRIFGDIKTPTSKLELVAYQYQLDIVKESVTVQTKNGNKSETVNVTEVYTDSDGNFTIHLGRELEFGEELEVYVKHIAQIKRGSGGLVHLSYLTETGEGRRFATTRFFDEQNERPFDIQAWRAFPCVDEKQITALNRGLLNIKSTFDLTIIRKENYTSLSNGELVSSTPDPKYEGWIIDKFSRTVPITPSRVSLLVSDFSHVSFTSKQNKTVRVHAPQHLLKNGGGKYAAEIGAKLFDFYESYFNTSSQSSKMDFAVIPKLPGSVESWGLSFLPHKIEDVSLLLKPNANFKSKLLVDGKIAESLARQWIGHWWNDNYFNLGIVKYLKYLGMEAADPEYSVLPQGTLQKALQTYVRKLTEEKGETDPEAFFQMLQDAAGNDHLNVSSFMHSWIDQVGYPVVKVSVLNDSFVQLLQEKFKVSEEKDLNQNSTWEIPITIFSEEKPHLENTTLPQFWLKQDGDQLSLEHNASDWIMVNYNATGYYRVFYEDSLLNLIQQQLEKDPSLINPLSKAQLLDDYFVFAEKNDGDIQTALNLTKYLYQETEYVVWRTVLNHFGQFDRRFSSHSAYSAFQKYVNNKLNYALTSIGIDDSPEDSTLRKALRSELLRWACGKGEPSPLCTAEAKKLLESWKVNGTSSEELNQPLACAAVAIGGKEAFVLYQQYEKLAKGNGTKEQRVNFLGPLACATDKYIVEWLYNSTIHENSTVVRLDDGKFILNELILKPHGRRQLLPFLRGNLDKFIEHFNSWNQPKPLWPGSWREGVATFMEINKGKLSISQSVDRYSLGITQGVEWMNSTGSIILEWLESV
ncbi:Aminopeptidase Q [Orchesella cincta]|uniref:Aminopeptidase Q n=1 Tax=Orchesella cincta TaxID=48709 RepID=A0A1D2MDR8_ORCCI|nr:Aminopeptidase Q [Orchesella cincta]